MNNNLAKNRFFSRSIQLDLTSNKISIKQIILQQLQNTITSRFAGQKKNHLTAKLLLVLDSLSDKVILSENSDLSSLVYSCAIAFPLANIWGLPSLQVAQELASSFAIKYQNSVEELTLQFTVRVTKNGLIEFSLSDRSVGYWLGFVMKRLQEHREMGELGELGKIGDYNLFPGQYVYHRCSSLLLLGTREGLIDLEDSDCTSGIWQITNSNPFKYYCDENIRYCYEPSEINLLRQLLLVIDGLDECNFQNPQTLFQLTLNLCHVCLTFLADCRIFGSVSQHQPNLAIARLGLIAIVQSCLRNIILNFGKNKNIKVDRV